jgi:hypothetical protein
MVASAPRQRERPWLAASDRGVPATLEPYPRETLVDVLDQTARERPDHPAVLFKRAIIFRFFFRTLAPLGREGRAVTELHAGAHENGGGEKNEKEAADASI